MIHTTRDGQRIPIVAMGNNHLLNTMKLWVTQLESAVGANLPKINKEFFARVTGVELKENPVEIEAFAEKFPYYLMEAIIRGMDVEDIMDRVRTVYELQGLTAENKQKLLEATKREAQFDSRTGYRVSGSTNFLSIDSAWDDLDREEGQEE